MLNKVALLIVAVVLMQLVYFVLKSAKDRANGGDNHFKGVAYVRGCMLLILFIALLFFMLF
ncbi:MAG: hypothetical protein DI539_14965 [Flavobacterium psychrophilum]|nr:MAG: hypothetical protein DI539_14965 [Flavobacterium psychrophilum]